MNQEQLSALMVKYQLCYPFDNILWICNALSNFYVYHTVQNWGEVTKVLIIELSNHTNITVYSD